MRHPPARYVRTVVALDNPATEGQVDIRAHVDIGSLIDPKSG